MTGPRRGERAAPFTPDELEGASGVGPEELAAEARLARELEGVASRLGAAPAAGFAERVMAAVAAEPVPAPAIAAGSALRAGATIGFLASIRDAFRVAFGGGFPAAARAQALVIVLLVAGVMAGTGYAAAGAMGLLGDRGTPMQDPAAVMPTAAPTPSPTPGPTARPRPQLSAPSLGEDPTPTPEPSETAEPAEPADGSDESSGPGEEDDGATGNGGPAPTKRPAPRRTAEPAATPTATPEHDEDDHHRTPKPSRTPRASASPSPSPSPADD